MSNAVSFKEGDRVEVGGFVVFVSRFWRNWGINGMRRLTMVCACARAGAVRSSVAELPRRERSR